MLTCRSVNVAFLLMLVVGPAFAQMYKCQVGSTVTFSDKPCGKDAKIVRQANETPSEDSRKESLDRAKKSQDSVEKSNAKVREEDLAKSAAEQKKPVVTMSQLALQCVDRYRPHLAYPQGVTVRGQKVEIDGFGHTLYVSVQTITNSTTQASLHQVVLDERFACRLDPATDYQSIDDKYTSEYVEKHARGAQL